ncbi:MAG: hypothetical protein U0996_26310 [Planctomycetaceae bacterium]
MNSPDDGKSRVPLEAGPRDRFLGVQELTEHTFCSRAGQNSAALKTADTGSDDHVSPLDFPYDLAYEVREIDRRLKLYCFRFIAWIASLCCLIYITPYESLDPDSLMLWFKLGSILAIAVILRQDTLQMVHWFKERIRCTLGTNQLPNADDPNVEIINWWQMHRNGFEPVPDRHLSDDALKLSGRPFILLRKGDQYVPVFRRDSDRPELFPQHFVRIAAYCLLLERQTGGRAPYGLVLDRGTFRCQVIKYNRESHGLLAQHLLAARKVIQNAEQFGALPPAPPAALCAGCPYGKPLEAGAAESLAVTETTGLVQFGQIGSDGKRYHSHCGDRFRWTPPSEEAIRLKLPGLEPSVQPRRR